MFETGDRGSSGDWENLLRDAIELGGLGEKKEIVERSVPQLKERVVKDRSGAESVICQ
eukprot:gene4125-14233_t